MEDRPSPTKFFLLKSLFFLCFPDSLRETGMTSMADLDSSSLLLASRRTSAKVRSLEKMVAEMLLLPCFSKERCSSIAETFQGLGFFLCSFFSCFSFLSSVTK